MGINETFSDHLGSNFDQSYSCCNFIADKLCNFQNWKVFLIFKRKWLTEKRNISNDIHSGIQSKIKSLREILNLIQYMYFGSNIVIILKLFTDIVR